MAGACGGRSFRSHVTSYVLVMGLLVAIWALTSPGGYFWPIWPMLGWGIGIAAHGLRERNRMSSGDERWPSPCSLMPCSLILRSLTPRVESESRPYRWLRR